MQPNNEDLVTRAMNNNKVRESLILEKIAAGREAKKNEILWRSQSNLDNSLRDDLEPEDMFIDGENLDSGFNEIPHQNVLNLDDSNVDFKIIDKEEKMNIKHKIQKTGQTPRHPRNRLAKNI